MRWLGAFLMAACCLVAAADEQKSFPVGKGGRLFDGPDVEQLLSRLYRNDVPMACTGACLWVGHPGGWAFPEASVNWYLLTGRGLGLDVTLTAQDQLIAPSKGQSYPSHVALSAEGPVAVEGAKWITADDVLVTRLTLKNTSAAAVDVKASATVPAESPDATGESLSWTIDHAGLTLYSIASLPGFALEQITQQQAAVYTKEGEDFGFQTGSSGPDTKAAASGGKVLGSNFGGQAGSYALWNFDVKERIENAALTFRYARANEGNADVAVQIPGQKRMQRRMFAPTGGWGDAESQFALQTFPVGPLEAGSAQIKLYVIAAGGNINIDALYLHDAKTKVGGVLSKHSVAARVIHLEPGASETILAAEAVAAKKETATAALKRVKASADPLADQIAAYEKWNIDNVPSFAAHDPALTKMYWHRATSILRKNLFRVGEGRLKDWGISEGRWTSDWYANIISYGAGHQIREARWLRDPQYVNGIISTWCANEKPNGVFPNFIRVKEIGDGQYTDWITSTVWDAYCVHPDAAKLKSWADALKKNVDGWLATYDTDNDGLLLVDSHWWTGMEWQPSFFYFNGFDKDQQKQQLERVDLTAYVYGNAVNLAKVLAQLGDTDGAKKYDDIAVKIRDAVKQTMWDDASQFFYSVEPEKGDKALVKEVIGVYPFYFSMFAPEDKAYLGAWKSILDPEEFWTAWPVASASKKCKAYSQDVTFNGKQVGGCMWNGPTWPHANSIVLSAMAATLREYPESPVTTDKFYELFQSFTKAQFKDQNMEYPWTGEYYNGDIAQWRTDQRDYNHSTWLDILIADIAGLRAKPGSDLPDFVPLISKQMGPFMIDGIRYHDHDISILWNPKGADEAQPDNLMGYRVYIDGKLAVHKGDNAVSMG